MNEGGWETVWHHKYYFATALAVRNSIRREKEMQHDFSTEMSLQSWPSNCGFCYLALFLFKKKWKDWPLFNCLIQYFPTLTALYSKAMLIYHDMHTSTYIKQTHIISI